MSERYDLTALLAARARELAESRQALARAEAVLRERRRVCTRLTARLAACDRAVRSSGQRRRAPVVSAAVLVGSDRFLRRADRARRRIRADADRERIRLLQSAAAVDAARVRVAETLRAWAAVDDQMRALRAEAERRDQRVADEERSELLAAHWSDRRDR